METIALIDLLTRGEGSRHQFWEGLRNLLNAHLSGYYWHHRGS